MSLREEAYGKLQVLQVAVRAYELKGRSIWQASSSASSSWSWKKILQLKSLARQFVVWKDGIEIWPLAKGNFSVADVWKEIRSKREKVTWHKLLWGSIAIPKHTIVVWMAILNRLPTKDRLISWDIDMNGTCCLCQEEPETRDHIFFGCIYSRSIWEKLLSLCGINREIGNWSEELQWAAQNLKGRNLTSTLLRLAWKTLIYQVWKERNGRLHGNTERTNLQVLEAIKDVTCIRLAGIKNDTTTRHLRNSWGLF